MKFATLSGNYKGVAVSLKRFLTLLEKYGIDHPDERFIRMQLSPRRDATTRSKSYFLKNDVVATRIDRSRAARYTTTALTCVCVSYHNIPQDVKDILMDGQTMHLNNNYI